MLQLPPTIRAPRPEEMPERQDIEQLLAKRKTAKIVEGFRIEDNKTPQLPYTFYAEVNVDNSRLWDLFVALSDSFPEQICVEYNIYEEEMFISGHFSKALILQELSSMKQELTQDGTIVFGLLSHTKQALDELHVTDSKYIRFWGRDKELFLKCMNSFGLLHIKDIEFVDDYPKVVDPLRRFISEARRPEDVISKLDRTFQVSSS